jgi:catechol 2,3-dioxygenase
MNTEPINSEVRIGHVHLNVSDLEPSLHFYCDVLGFVLVQRWGSHVVFVSAGSLSSSHWTEYMGDPGRITASGWCHRHFSRSNSVSFAGFARRRIATADRRRHSARGASDHGVSDALYVRDPDGIGLELYCDKAQTE